MPRSPLFGRHSLLFVPHSPLFEPFEPGAMRGQELLARREGGGMPHEGELAAFFLPFGRLEARGTWREEEERRREERGTWREEVFAGREASSGWEEVGGMRLAGLAARRLALALFDN